MRTHNRIGVNSEVMAGKPVVRGTRITVEQILRELSSGMAPEQIVHDHPRLSIEDIYAAEAFAAD